MPQHDTSSAAARVAERFVFVYGSLRQGGSNDITRLVPAPRWVGRAVIAGTLFDLGPYPGAVLGGAGRVVGEVYAISAALERRLDEIEEVHQHDEYLRREIQVEVEGRALPCLVYEINSRVPRREGVHLLPAGDWLAR